jgi:aldehyde dehydrogenase (NAD+)
VNKRHFERLSRLIDDAATRGAEVFRLGESKPEINYLAPAILTNLPPDAAIMQEEIFGPLLPVFSWEKLEDAIEFVVSREKPLSLYIFTGSADVRERILSTTSAGGGCVGDTILQFANPYMPFGGFGESGMGRAHGVHGFDEFTNERAMIFRPPLLMKLLYPPYGRVARALSEVMLRWL